MESDQTVNALVAAGFDLPKRLLFMHRSKLSHIPHLGDTGLAEIEAYQRHISKMGQHRNQP